MRGHVPAAVTRLHLQPLGRLLATNRLNLAIGLPLRNQQALNNLLQQIYDPASPNYRHYLTPEQFTEQFGPTETDYQAVVAFMESKGLTVTYRHPNRVVLDVNGSVADIEKAFHVGIQVYQHPTEARTFYTPDVEPLLDLTVPILHISGLDNFAVPHPASLKTEPAGQMANARPNSGSGPGGSYMGNDFRTTYAPGVTLNGSGQIVGLLEFDGYYSSDIQSYEMQARLRPVTLMNMPIDGGVSTPGNGVGEVSLDIEMAISMAPGLSKVIVYEAPNPSPWEDILSRMANDNLAKQLSCSWYNPGGGPNTNADQIFQQMAAQGQSFFQASGDKDAYTGPIDFPSDNPYITQVGGTILESFSAGGAAREDHTETLLPDGKVLVAGGGGSSSGPLSSAELYDPATGTWTNTGSLNIARENHTATLLANGKVLVAGGDNYNAPLSSAELYDPATGTWTLTGSMAYVRTLFTATLLTNGQVLVAGGTDMGGNYTSSAELFNPATGTWTPTGAMITGRNEHTAALLTNGQVLVAGGWGGTVQTDGYRYLSSAELYNPATGTWTTTGSMNVRRMLPTETLLTNGLVLAAAGFNYPDYYISSAELYNPITGAWTNTGSMTYARYGQTATLLLNGEVLITGGPNASDTAELYDPSMGTWTVTGAMTSVRENHTASLLTDGQVLVAGGYNYVNLLSSAELYDPASGTWTNTGAMVFGGASSSETTWNQGGGIGSGGGISTYYTIPGWQQGINMTANHGSTTMRNVPDVAMIADNVYVIYNHGQSGSFHGTSCAAPLWAGFIALVNQQAVAAGRPKVGFINPAVYSIGEGPNYTADFHDVTTGDDTWSGSPNNFYAVPSYDLCTGWGTPAGQNLINDLAGSRDWLGITPATGFTASGLVGGPFDVTSQNLSLTNSGAGSLDWTLVNTSSWLNVSSESGTLAIGEQTTVTISLNSTTSNLWVGSYTANIWFTNQTDGVAQSRQFNLLVGQLVQNGGFETGDFSDWTVNGYSRYINVVSNETYLPSRSGNCVAALGEPFTLASLSQTLPTVVGQSYLLSLWLENTTNPNPPYRTTPNEFIVNWGGNTLFDESDIGIIGWTNLQFVVTAATTNTVLQFAFLDQPWYLSLDVWS